MGDRYVSLSKGAGASLKYVRLRYDAANQSLIKERGPPGAVDPPYSFTFKAESHGAANAVFDATVKELQAKGYSYAHDSSSPSSPSLSSSSSSSSSAVAAVKDESHDSKRAAQKRVRSPSLSPSRDRDRSPAVERPKKKAPTTPTKKPAAAAGASSSRSVSPPPSPSLPIPKKSKILKGLHLCISGALSMLRVKFQDYLRQHGAGISASVNGSCTHLISTEDDVKFKGTSKTTKAITLGLPIVTEHWIHDSLRAGKQISTSRYLITDDDNGAADPFAGDVGNNNDDDDDDKPSRKKAKKEKAPAKKKKKNDSDDDGDNGDDDGDDGSSSPAAASSSSRAVKREQRVKRENSDDDNDNNHANNGAANDFKPILSTTACYKMFDIDTTITLQQMLKSKGLTMRETTAFYELLDRKERITSAKLIVLISKSSNSIVFDDAKITREFLGVTSDEAFITRSSCTDYYVFIQSHLASRKLDAGARVLIKGADDERAAFLRLQASQADGSSSVKSETKDIKVKVKVEARDNDDDNDDEREHKHDKPASSSSSSSSSSSPSPSSSTAAAAAGPAKKRGASWTCSKCTLENASDVGQCGACNNDRRKVTGKFPWGLKWVDEEPTFLVLDSKDVAPSSRIIGFDMDSTLIEPKSGKKFPTGQKDWKWLDDSVADTLRDKYRQGYKLVIFTNQAGIKKGKTNAEHIKGKILDVIKELGVPMQAFIAAASDWFRKPATTMWDHMVASCNGGLQADIADCLYVGDAAGRPKGWRNGASADFSVADRAFAHNIGLPFQTPEEFFHNEKPVKFSWKTHDPADLLKMAQKRIDENPAVKPNGYIGKLPLILGRQELVIFTGSPACGKSTFARSHFVSAGYTRVNQDELKTKPKCLSVCRTAIAAGKSVVIDNTNPEVSTRKEYIAIAKEYDVPVRCFWFDIPRALSDHLNLYREKMSRGERARLPGMVINIWHGKFAEPTTKEGYLEVARVLFVPTFKTASDRTIFLQRIAPER